MRNTYRKANMHSDEYLVYSAIEAQGNIGEGKVTLTH